MLSMRIKQTSGSISQNDMGLEDFIDDDDSSSSSSSSSTSSGSANTDPIGDNIDDYDMQFYGAGQSVPPNTPMEREEALSDYSMSKASSAVTKDIEFSNDHVKLYAPVFFTIDSNPKYEGGKHYRLVYNGETPRPSWNNRVVSCIGSYGTRLGNVHKESIMYATGEYEKSEVIKSVKKSLGEDIDEETHTYITFFGDMFMLRDLAQANHEFREGDLINRDKIMHQVLSAKTLKSRVDNE